jgi:methionine sulfoxide reductase catalytic subunit
MMIPYSAVTPKQAYMNRRRFLASGAAAMGALATPFSFAAGTQLAIAAKSPFSTTEKPTPREVVTTWNNYYEFGMGYDLPSKNSTRFQTRPWTVSIEGEVAKPVTFDIDQILKLAPLEERIYRHRCVERWSIVVPWIGYSLSALLKQVEPTSKAKYVAFQSHYDPKQMPLAKSATFKVPYVEGLRIDEAMHPLVLLCVGLYGEVLPNQNGAPMRIVVPWKYGYKSIKSVVKIRFVEKEPPTSWGQYAGLGERPGDEYGFYSNVNPQVEHPRWSQMKEQRIGVDASIRTPTRMFNGYAEQVASIYKDMDLRKFH